MNFDPLESQISWEIDFSTSLAGEASQPQLPAEGAAKFADRFRIESLLGSGGTGSVYLAEELGVGRKVAIKVLNGSVTERQQKRFVQEGQLTAALDHPGIVRVYGVGQADGHDFLVYEWVEGGRPLDAGFAERSVSERLELLLQVCEAVGAAHAAGVVHRDLKSENVLVDPAGRVRILDFGIAHSTEADRLTKSGEIVGTPLYMAPERFGSLLEITPALDVWSIGVMIHLAITEAYPFEAPTLLQLVAALARPLEEHQDLPPALHPVMALCRRCLNPEPSERYADANHLVADLRLAVGGRLGSETKPKLWRPALACLALIVILTGVLGAGALGAGVLGAGARTPPWTPEAVERFLAEAPPLSWAEAWEKRRFASPESREALALAILESDRPLEERIEFGLLAVEAEGASPRPQLVLARLYAESSEFALSLDLILKARAVGAPEPELIAALIHLAARDEALACVDQLLRVRGWSPQGWGPPLVLGLLDANPDLGARALRRLSSSLGRDPLIALRARASAAFGGDPRPELESALRRTAAEAVRLELALTHLDHEDRASALEVLRGSATSECKSLADFVEAPHAEAPPPWRKTMLRTLWAEVRLELALAHQPGALPLDERRSRVLGLARSLRVLGTRGEEVALLEAWAQKTPPSFPYSSRLSGWALRLQADSLLAAGRAAEIQAADLPPPSQGPVLLAQGRAREAFEVLNPLTQRQELPTLETASKCLDSARALHSEQVPRLQKLVASLRGELTQEAGPALLQLQQGRQRGWRSPEDEDAAIERVLAVDPANVEALLHYARALYSRGQAAGEELCFALSVRYPVTITKLQRIALAPARRLPKAQSEIGRLFRRVHAAEVGLESPESSAGLILELDGVLTKQPAFHWARILRAFVAIRARRLGRAEADLRAVLEVEPACAQAHFYRALLSGAQRNPSQVLARFSDAIKHGYQRESGWSPKRYPEFALYLDRAGFELLSTR